MKLRIEVIEGLNYAMIYSAKIHRKTVDKLIEEDVIGLDIRPTRESPKEIVLPFGPKTGLVIGVFDDDSYEEDILFVAPKHKQELFPDDDFFPL